MKNTMASGDIVEGRVKIQLVDKFGKVRHEEDGDNAITEYGKLLLKYSNLLSRLNQQRNTGASGLKGASPMIGYAPNVINIGRYLHTHDPSMYIDGGGLNLLGNVQYGISKFGETRGYTNDEVVGYAYNDVVSGNKQGAVVTSEMEYSCNRTTTVYAFPSGVGTGTIHHLIRGSFTGPASGQPFTTTTAAAAFDTPVVRINNGGEQDNASKDNVFTNKLGGAVTPFFNYVTKTAYNILRPTMNTNTGFDISRNRWTEVDGVPPYYTRLSVLHCNIPISSWTWSYVNLIFCNDDFCLCSFNGGNSPHVFGKYVFASNTWSWPSSDGGREYIQRDYSYTSSSQNEDRFTRYSNLVASYDGNHIYSFYAYVRNEADSGLAYGKAKIDTNSWKVVARKDGGFTASGSVAQSIIIPYSHSPYSPGKMAMMMPHSSGTAFSGYDLLEIMGWRPDESQLQNVYIYDAFDPEDHFITGIVHQNDIEWLNANHAVGLTSSINNPYGNVIPNAVKEHMPFYQLVQGKKGKFPYSPFMMLPMGQEFQDPWAVLRACFCIFSKYTLSTPIEKGPEDSLRIEYTYEIPDPYWEILF